MQVKMQRLEIRAARSPISFDDLPSDESLYLSFNTSQERAP